MDKEDDFSLTTTKYGSLQLICLKIWWWNGTYKWHSMHKSWELSFTKIISTWKTYSLTRDSTWYFRRKAGSNNKKVQNCYHIPINWSSDELKINYIVNFQTFTPATTASFFMALLTIMIASWRDLSVSSMNCSAPPLRIMVQVFAWGQPVNKLYLK